MVNRITRQSLDAIMRLGWFSMSIDPHRTPVRSEAYLEILNSVPKRVYNYLIAKELLDAQEQKTANHRGKYVMRCGALSEKGIHLYEALMPFLEDRHTKYGCTIGALL